MKCYSFYFRVPTVNGTKGKWDLYALTNNKELATNFMKQRNMKICKILKDDMDKSDYYKFVDKNKMSVLSQNTLTSIVRDSTYKNGYYLVDVPMVMTEYEIAGIEEITENFVMSSITGDAEDDAFYPPYIFTKKIQKALENLEYHKFFIHKMKCFPGSILSKDTAMYIANMDDYDMPNMIVDELSMFINIFKHTLFKHSDCEE